MIKKQSGNSLVEAIIAVALVAMVTNGTIYASSRATTKQSNISIQEIALAQMRDAIMNSNNDICTTPPVIELPNSIDITTEVQGCNNVVTATITPDVALPMPIVIPNIPAPLIIGANDPSIGGPMVVGGTWTGTLPAPPE